MEELLGSLAARGGPWAAALGIGGLVLWLLARGLLVTRSMHRERLADKQELVAFYKATAEQALATAKDQHDRVVGLMEKLDKALSEFNGSG